MIRTVVLVAVISSACQTRNARPPAAPVATSPAGVAALGETWTLDSKILGERRVINVYLPPDYATSDARYPVLYALDGGMKEDFPHVVGSVDVSTKNAIIRPTIVVGIENTVRRRDLLGPTSLPEEQKAAPLAGGNTRFRQFLRDELLPAIARRYRTTDETAIIGESAAGLFVIETFLVEPSLFDGYIAADPSVWWNEESLVREASARLASYAAGPTRLYVASANEERTNAAIEVLETALRIQNPPGVTWRHEPMPHEGHGTIFPTAALHGIRLLFAAEPH